MLGERSASEICSPLSSMASRDPHRDVSIDAMGSRCVYLSYIIHLSSLFRSFFLAFFLAFFTASSGAERYQTSTTSNINTSKRQSRAEQNRPKAVARLALRGLWRASPHLWAFFLSFFPSFLLLSSFLFGFFSLSFLPFSPPLTIS